MTAIVTFSGFTETDRTFSGTAALFRDVIEPLRKDGVKIFDLRPWDTDTKGLANLVQRRSIRNVIIVGYSWGAGYTAQRFTRQLAKRGIAVPCMLLCDPVYRPLWLPTWGFANILGFRALIHCGARIRISPNVRAVAAMRQVNKAPMGHPLRLPAGTSLISDRTLPAYSHTEIDAAPEWHALVQQQLNHHLKP